MSELAESNPGSHPVGWAFLGVGALPWLLPLGTRLGFDLEPILPYLAETWGSLLALMLVTLFGAVLDFGTRFIESPLLRLTRLSNPPGQSWAAAWRRRWASQLADHEFRRHEGMVSLARVYLVHSVLATTMLCVGAPRWGARVLIFAAGMGALGFWLLMWRWHTSRILVLVRSAALWEPSDDQSA